jgi:hypothetical protein
MPKGVDEAQSLEYVDEVLQGKRGNWIKIFFNVMK